MFNLILPTFFIGESAKAKAQNLPNLAVSAQLPSVISAPPETFLVSSSKFQASDWLTNNFAASIGMSLNSIFGLFSTDAEKNLSFIPQPSVLLSQPAGSVRFDFDGDGKADLARWKSSASEWKIKNSSSGSLTTATIGNSSSIIAPGDFDGDGKTDQAVFNAGTWTIKKSLSGQTQTVSFGTAGDKPVVSDYDGDGLADCAVFRASTNTWWILKSSNGSYTSTAFGAAGDITAQGNFDSDTKTDIAVFRPSTGDWHVLGSSAGYFTFHWGIASDIPVPADYDGDGKTDFAVYRGSSGTWYVSKSSTNNANYTTQVWGNYGDQPVPADTDGDNKADYAIWRPTTGVWHTIKSSNGQFDYQTLGQTGETAVTSAYLKQIGGAVAGYDLAKARLAPRNATGGTDLYSQNFSWGTGLVGLSGRAGLGAGFGISYNSLVWTKEPVSNAVYFDADNSNVTPGFRFGFPTIEPVYYDKTAERFNYLMVTPSGARVEFRQLNGASDTFETADSSYTQLKTIGAAGPNDPVENFSLILSGTDGSTMTYLWKAGAFRCSQIKDRNGNFVTIVHDDQGLLKTVTDTLGRVINVNYDAQLDPVSVTQNWKDNNGAGSNTNYTWATFTYTTTNINTSFASGINVVGPANGTSLKVLQKITFPSGSATTFDYNSYGQVKQVSNYAADLHLLNYTKTNLDTPAANQTDCPRFTETRNWVENFNQNTGGVAQETVITNTLTANQTYNVGGISGTATKIEVSMANDPYQHVSKTFVGNSGWRESLPIATEDWANGTGGLERKRWTWTNWTQDDTNLSYIQNPRTIESKIGDTTNIKRTTTEYLNYPLTNIAKYGLVSAVNVYGDDQTTVWKTAVTEYNLDVAYISRRIIGLPSQTEVWGLNQQTNIFEKVSKNTYTYDEGNFSDTTLAQNLATAIQHDNTNYGASFITGRGNTTSVTRYDVTGQTANVTSQVKYNTAGAAVAQIDPLGRTVKIGYADAFNDNLNRNSFAYPTTLTDPANNSSTVKYRYDIGANVWANSPAPAGNSTGKETTRLYDAIGRLSKETLVNTGAYSRYEYPANQVQSKVYSTVIDTNNNGADAADEVFAESWTDGAGRVRRSRTEHPNSTGGYAGSLVEYDILGQVTRSTVPTEINSSYAPSGDDATRGWLWTSQEYDWKGRPTRTINTDGTDTLASYDGCGCAGGQITTIQGELVPRDDQPTVMARRTQKIYADILGRSYKTEVLNWDAATPYTTTVQTFNGRDQVTNTRQYAGSINSTTFQDVTMTYDGHGRMKTRHYPVEDANTNTNWIYNTDDSVQQVIDPRNVITTFSYNSRGLTSGIAYQKPANSTIPETPDVSFIYDALGNRTQMTDGLGTVNYEYNQLSQMTAENRIFNTSLSDAPVGGYKLQYAYHLGGGLKSVTDPFNAEVNYTNDKTGRITSVVGTPFGDDTTGEYVDNIKYRAFGQVKQMDYKTDDNGQIRLYYDNRLRVSQHEVLSQTAQSGYLTKAVFSYYADSHPQTMDNQVNDNFDRTFKYDFAGRLTANNFGNGQGIAPYTQTLTYDPFSQLTQRTATHWNRPVGFGATYLNGRKQPFGIVTPSYDAAGNMLNSGANSGTSQASTFDEANRQNTVTTRTRHDYGQHVVWIYEQNQTESYDGDGHPLKTTYLWQRIGTPPLPPSVENKYQMWSSVMGSALTELTDTGAKEKTRVYAGGAVIAEQTAIANNNRVEWLTADPLTGSSLMIRKNGTLNEIGHKELEPLGQEILLEQPEPEDPVLPGTVSANSADNGEWLCGVPGYKELSFNDKPAQCKIAALESGNLFLGDLYKKGNPEAVTDAAPHENPHSSSSASAMPVNITPTTKPQGTNGSRDSARAIPETSIPTDGGDDGYYNDYSSNGNSLTIKARHREISGPSLPDDFEGAEYAIFLKDGINASLSEGAAKKIDKAINDLKTFKPSDDCQKNVIDKLGIKLEDFQKYLEKGANVYDIEKSTVSVVGSIYTEAQAKLRGLSSTDKISETYKDKEIGKTPDGKKITSRTNAITSISTSVFTTYIRSDAIGGENRNKAWLFHEALHGFGKVDEDLETAFFGKETTESKDISNYIKKHCFK